jgi:membrane protease YdiL (CAAX protease family)
MTLPTVGPYQYRPVLFYLATMTVSWIPWLIGYYLGRSRTGGGPVSLLNLVGLLGPFLVAMVLILASGSSSLKSDFRDRLLQVRRIRPRYLFLAIVIPPAVIVLSILISLGFGQSTDQLRIAGPDNVLGMIVLALILAPVIEELGWRGYGVDSLRATMGTLQTTLLFGVLWGLWHAPLVLIPGTYQHELATMENPLFLVNFFVSVIPVAILANWLYYRNDRSIVIGMLLHSMGNAAAVLLNAGQVAKTIATVVYAVLVLVIIRRDREVFGAGPRNFVS